MNVGKYLATTTAQLQKAGILTARLDVLILLEDALGKGRASLLAHPELVIEPPRLAILNNNVIQRKKHVPLAYIRGKAMFFGREFGLNNKVLVPRPETESIIEILKGLPIPPSAHIADIGCGSGCIGITAALELPGTKVYLYDTDSAALAVTAKNAETFKIAVQVVLQDLLSGCNEQFDVVLANLPYVPEAYPVNDAARHEPKIALFSGIDGLDHYRKLWKQIREYDPNPTHVVLESFPEQHPELAGLGRAAGYSLQATNGYAQHFIRLSAIG